MRKTSDATDPTPAAALRRLAALLRQDDLDGAIAAGLMAFDATAMAEGPDRHRVLEAQRRLQRAWAARERYRARNARLARRAAQRDAAAGTLPAGPAAVAAMETAVPGPAGNAPRGPAPAAPGGALPPAALAALARATARARERGRG